MPILPFGNSSAESLFRVLSCHWQLERVSIRDNGRSYVVETDGGAAYLRNRRYIKASTATARRNMVGASIAAVDKGKKREGVRFKLMVRFEKPGSKD